MDDPAAHPDESPEIEAFWQQAHRQARLDSLPGYLGPTPLASVPPPAWSFGADPEAADALLDLVLDGTKTATASAFEDYEGDDDPVPTPGTLGIVLDSGGTPRALLATTRVDVVAFDRVDEEHARLEGEGDGTLAWWRAAHERFFTENDPTGRGFRTDMPVVLERFEVLHPVERRGPLRRSVQTSGS